MNENLWFAAFAWGVIILAFTAVVCAGIALLDRRDVRSARRARELKRRRVMRETAWQRINELEEEAC